MRLRSVRKRASQTPHCNCKLGFFHGTFSGEWPCVLRTTIMILSRIGMWSQTSGLIHSFFSHPPPPPSSHASPLALLSSPLSLFPPLSLTNILSSSLFSSFHWTNGLKPRHQDTRFYVWITVHRVSFSLFSPFDSLQFGTTIKERTCFCQRTPVSGRRTLHYSIRSTLLKEAPFNHSSSFASKPIGNLTCTKWFRIFLFSFCFGNLPFSPFSYNHLIYLL